MITHNDMQTAYDEVIRHNALIQDALRREVKLLRDCYVRSLGGEDVSSCGVQSDMERLVRIEQTDESGKYEKCPPSCLSMNNDGAIAFRMCTLINGTPTGNLFIPAYITMAYYENLIKVGMSISNSRSNKQAELYVSRGEEPERYEEVADYIKGMIMRFIADQKLPG